MPVNLERHGDIAVVTLDNPPVNALGQAMRAGLMAVIDTLSSDTSVRAVVLTGKGRLFVGGADITEFDRPPEGPHLPDIFARIEASPAPWIAALHGSALGGGLELALACHHRIAAPDTRLGLPEVNLGIIPGAGGTQRLPRLIGVQAALPVVAENRVLDAAQALDVGLIDRLAEGPLTDAALDFARALPPATLARDRAVADPGPDFWQAAEARVAKASRGMAAPPLALQAVRHSVERGFDAGLAHERATFLQLRASEQAAALRHLFFAERAAPRPATLRDVTPLPLRSVGVVGGGTMGAGIAAALRNAGLPVVLSERDEAALARGMTTLRGVFDATAKRGLITPEVAEARFAGVTGTVGLAALADCDLVIEAVFEDLAVKREVFAALSRLCRSDAILATNTSYLDPRDIAQGFAGQDRFIGLHFFSPAQVMKLLEIVPLPDTSAPVLSTAFDLARRMGKVPVRAGICEGFIGNRILRHMRTTAETLLREGVRHGDIDAAMRGFGFAMGPFETQDLSGLDISYMIRQAARARGEDVPDTPGDILVRAGRKGQKTGGGWYDYAPGDRTPRHSAEVNALLAPMMGAPKSMESQAIADRLVGAMATEGRRILDEGVAGSPADIDLVEVHGYGFPRAKGGPMFLAARAGKAQG